MIPIQILRVLSTIQRYDVSALLMGGQACVLYGAAEYSRDLDLAVLATSADVLALRTSVTGVSSRGGQAFSARSCKVSTSRRGGHPGLRDVDGALASEQTLEMAADRAYWEPLRRELESLRYAVRRT